MSEMSTLVGRLQSSVFQEPTPLGSCRVFVEFFFICKDHETFLWFADLPLTPWVFGWFFAEKSFLKDVFRLLHVATTSRIFFVRAANHVGTDSVLWPWSVATHEWPRTMKLLVDHWGYIFRMTQEGEYDWEAFQAPKETEGNQRRNMENWMRKKSEYRIPSWEPTYPTYGRGK